MDRPSAPWAVALTAGAALGILAVLQTWWPDATQATVQPTVHIVLITLAVVVTATLAVLSLRIFYASGSTQSLALAVGLSAFAAVYVWHGAYTHNGPPFAFLIYGPFSRATWGLALPFLAAPWIIAKERRFVAVAGVVAGTALLAIAAWSLHPALSTYATGATQQEMQTLRLTVEAFAGVMAFVSLALLLVRHPGRRGANMGIALPVALLGLGSVYFLVSAPWSWAWWGAHAIGAVSSVALTVAVVVELGRSEKAREVDDLRHLNAMRTRFINAAAHELGTPLTPIQLQLSLLRVSKDTMTERQQKSLETIQRNVDRLAELARSILEGARSQAGHFPIRLETSDLRDTLDDLERSYAPWCTEKGLTFTLEAPTSVPMYTDRRRIQQIASNFVSNAIKNTPPEGHVRVEARVKKRRLRITVTDTGRGMTEQERHRLFQPFVQLDDPSKVIGSGLGLYITRQLAERLGGSVGVTSRGMGRGASFFLELPLEAPETDASGGSLDAVTVAAHG